MQIADNSFRGRYIVVDFSCSYGSIATFRNFGLMFFFRNILPLMWKDDDEAASLADAADAVDVDEDEVMASDSLHELNLYSSVAIVVQLPSLLLLPLLSSGGGGD